MGRHNQTTTLANDISLLFLIQKTEVNAISVSLLLYSNPESSSVVGQLQLN